MRILDLGLIDYPLALDKQLEILESVIEDRRQETIIFCSHPPVVTLGRATKALDIQGWEGDTVSATRGGRATYHGPGQVVAYPILDLNLRQRDLHQFMRNMELAMIVALKEYGIVANGDIKEATGVWVQDRKIASIGIAVKKWVSYHGLAININADPQAFKGIMPCGFSANTMTSLEDLLCASVDKEEFQKILSDKLQYFLGASKLEEDVISL